MFCHGNLNPVNIIYDAPTNSVSFVGLQFCGPNFQAFDIAQHFMTLCGPDLSKVGKEEFVPAREFQLRWCHHYLSAYKDISTQKVVTFHKVFPYILAFSHSPIQQNMDPYLSSYCFTYVTYT